MSSCNPCTKSTNTIQGSIATNEGSINCTLCNNGYYSSTTGASSCIKCSAGYYSLSGKSSCSICPSNHYCPQGSASPIACPDGYTSNQGSKVSSDCKSPFDCATYGGKVLNNYCYKIISFKIGSGNPDCGPQTAGHTWKIIDANKMADFCGKSGVSKLGGSTHKIAVVGNCTNTAVTYYSHSSCERKHTTQHICNVVGAYCTSYCSVYDIQYSSTLSHDRVCEFSLFPSRIKCSTHGSIQVDTPQPFSGRKCVGSGDKFGSFPKDTLYSVCITDL